MSKKHLYRTIMTALFAAMILLTTAYVLHIPVGSGGGYVHLGDAMIYLAASLLPMPFAMSAAAIGGALADVVSGAAIWALPTALIKGVMVIPFTHKNHQLLCRRNIFAPFLGVVIGVAGYFVAEIAIILLSGGALSVAVASGAVAVLPNVLQELGSLAVYILLATALDRMHFKSRFSQML